MPGEQAGHAGLRSIGRGSDFPVGAVAMDAILAVLAAAKIHGAGFGGRIFDGRQAGVLVAAIAERLLGAFAAGAPVVVLAGFNGDGIRGFLGDGGLGHGVLLVGELTRD